MIEFENTYRRRHTGKYHRIISVIKDFMEVMSLFHGAQSGDYRRGDGTDASLFFRFMIRR